MRTLISTVILMLLLMSTMHAQQLPSFFKIIDGPPNSSTYSGEADTLSNGDFIMLTSEYIDLVTKYDFKLYTIHPEDGTINSITLPMEGQQIAKYLKTENDDVLWLVGEEYNITEQGNVSDVLILRLNSQLQITGSFQLDIDAYESVHSLLPLGEGRVAVHTRNILDTNEATSNKVSVIDFDNQTLLWTNNINTIIFPNLATDGDNQLLVVSAIYNSNYNYTISAFNINDGAQQWAVSSIPGGCMQERINPDLTYLPATNSYIGMTPCYGLLEISATGDIRHDEIAPLYSSDPSDYFNSIHPRDTSLRIVTTNKVIDVTRNANGEFELVHQFSLPEDYLIGTIDHQGYIMYYETGNSNSSSNINLSIIPVGEMGVTGTVISEVLNPFEYGTERGSYRFHITEDGTRIQNVSKRVEGFIDFDIDIIVNSDEENSIPLPLGEWQTDMLYPTDNEGEYRGAAYKKTAQGETEDIYLITADATGVTDSIFLFTSKIYVYWHFHNMQTSDGNIVLVTQEINLNSNTRFSKTRVFSPLGQQLSSITMPSNYISWTPVFSLTLSNNNIIHIPFASVNGSFDRKIDRYSDGQLMASNNLMTNIISGDFFIGNISESSDGQRILIGGTFRTGSVQGFTLRPGYFIVDATTLVILDVVAIDLEEHENGNVGIANFHPDSDKIFLQYGGSDTRVDVLDSLYRHTVMLLEEDGTVLHRQQNIFKNFGDIILLNGGLHGNTLYATGQTYDLDRFTSTAFIAGTEIDEVVSTKNIQALTKELNCSIFPNPSSDQIEITWQQDHNNYQVYLLDNTGRPLKTWSGIVTPGQASLRTSVAHLPAGLYIIQVETKRGLITETFVKN